MRIPSCSKRCACKAAAAFSAFNATLRAAAVAFAALRASRAAANCCFNVKTVPLATPRAWFACLREPRAFSTSCLSASNPEMIDCAYASRVSASKYLAFSAAKACRMSCSDLAASDFSLSHACCRRTSAARAERKATWVEFKRSCSMAFSPDKFRTSVSSRLSFAAMALRAETVESERAKRAAHATALAFSALRSLNACRSRIS
mmetsp:Transcript_122272/g.351238  ORF Transcript_122272/g.351238 Transcript_122272/m.351238 type:complete len:204 (+) Transcript_122272:1516-2127(+)